MNHRAYVRNGILMGDVNNFIMFIMPFITRTIIIRKLGVEYVGLGSLFTSILQVLSLSELGFSTAVGYMLYRPLAENDVKRINAILGFLRAIYRYVGGSIVVISLFLLPFLDRLIEGEIPAGINIYILYGIYVVNTVISYFFSAYKKILISANQRYDIDVSVSSIILLAQGCLQIAALMLFENYYLFVMVYPIMTLAQNCLSFYVANRLFPECRCEGRLDKAEVQSLFKNTEGAFFYKVGSAIYLSVDNIVISAFLGLAILGRYNNYYYVVYMLILLFAVVLNSLRPVVGNILATEDNDRNWQIFHKINFYFMQSVVICADCCFVLYQDFERIWSGKDNLFSFDIVLLLVAYFFSGKIGAILQIYIEAAGLFWEGRLIPLISAGINLISNLILVNIIGIRGVLLSSVIGYVCISFPGYVHIVFSHLFNDKNKLYVFLKEIALSLADIIIVALLCVFTVCRIQVDGWGSLIIKGMASVVFCSIIVLAINVRNAYAKEAIAIIKRKLVIK